MGCDIHLYTEQKRTIRGSEKWVNCDNWKINRYYGHDEGESEWVLNSVYKGRNYNLFAMLANVRNYPGLDVISEPKGVPVGVSDQFHEASKRYGPDGHSHSWLTMRELHEYFSSHPTEKHTGMVDDKGKEAIERGDMPSWWCESGPGNLHYMEWEYENTSIKNLIESLIKHFEYYDQERDQDKCRIVFFFDN